MSDIAGAGSGGPRVIGPEEAVRRGIDGYVKFDGRATRPEFWWWVLAVLIVDIVVGVIDAIIGINILGFLVGLALLLPNIAVSIRRLHDTNRSGWWLLLALTFIGIIVLIIFYVQEGTRGPNNHGPVTV